MTDDASQLSNINVRPTYYASLRLACGATACVTVVDGEVIADIRDDNGRPIGARMTAGEASEFGNMLYAADRLC